MGLKREFEVGGEVEGVGISGCRWQLPKGGWNNADKRRWEWGGDGEQKEREEREKVGRGG